MSKPFLMTEEEIATAQEIWQGVRDLSFKARCIPIPDPAIKDMFRNIEYVLILIERDLADVFGKNFDPPIR
jgi:hypothetical protein